MGRRDWRRREGFQGIKQYLQARVLEEETVLDFEEVDADGGKGCGEGVEMSCAGEWEGGYRRARGEEDVCAVDRACGFILEFL